MQSNMLFHFVGYLVVYGSVAISCVFALIYVSARVNVLFQIIGKKKWFFKIQYLKAYWGIKRSKIALQRYNGFNTEDRKNIKNHLDDAEFSIRQIDKIFKGDNTNE